MKLEMRKAIAEQRAKLKQVITLQTFATEEDSIRAYNLAIKSYLSGLRIAFTLALKELETDGLKGE